MEITGTVNAQCSHVLIESSVDLQLGERRVICSHQIARILSFVHLQICKHRLRACKSPGHDKFVAWESPRGYLHGAQRGRSNFIIWQRLLLRCQPGETVPTQISRPFSAREANALDCTSTTHSRPQGGVHVRIWICIYPMYRALPWWDRWTLLARGQSAWPSNASDEQWTSPGYANRSPQRLELEENNEDVYVRWLSLILFTLMRRCMGHSNNIGEWHPDRQDVVYWQTWSLHWTICPLWSSGGAVEADGPPVETNRKRCSERLSA